MVVLENENRFLVHWLALQDLYGEQKYYLFDALEVSMVEPPSLKFGFGSVCWISAFVVVS